MEKFSNGNMRYNPYPESSIKGKLYKIVKEDLKSNGNIIGIKKFINEISIIFENNTNEIKVSILENIKKFENKNPLFDAEPDDISTKINDMISKADEEELLTDEIEDKEIKESLSEEMIDYMIKKIKS